MGVASQGGGGIPAEYQQVEWIGHANNTAVINGVSPYSNVERVILDVEFTVKPKYGGAIILAKSQTTFPCGTTNNDPSLTVRTHRGFDCSPVTSVNGAIARATYTFTKLENVPISSAFSLFGWSNANYTCGLKAYGAEMYDTSNVLVCDGVPVYRKADDVIGLYDVITQTFFPGTGTWTKGADV